MYFRRLCNCYALTPSLPYIMHAIRRGGGGSILMFFMVLHIISYKIITTEGIYTNFFPAENTFRFQHHCFRMFGKQWFKNVRMTGISSFTIADSN